MSGDDNLPEFNKTEEEDKLGLPYKHFNPRRIYLEYTAKSSKAEDGLG